MSPVVGPLLVFDFDHTITDLNTDVEVQKLAPGGEIPSSSEMRGLYSDKGWTEFMGAVFSLLHENQVSQVRVAGLSSISSSGCNSAFSRLKYCH